MVLLKYFVCFWNNWQIHVYVTAASTGTGEKERKSLVCIHFASKVSLTFASPSCTLNTTVTSVNCFNDIHNSHFTNQ